MRRYAILPAAALLLVAALPLAGCALSEGMTGMTEVAPGEVEEFELAPPEASPEPSPESTAAQTPLPTLEPGSLNYPRDKVNFEGEIWTILTRRWGLADFQAAGLMSSLYAESSFSPYDVQGRDGVDARGRYQYRTGDGVGFGLGQWTSAGRKAALRRYAVQHGDANLVWDFDIQMGYMHSEIDLNALKAAATLYDATEWAVMRYERPSQAYENSWPGSRYEIARQIFKAHTKKAYREPELVFSARTEEGAAATGGFILFGDGSLTVTSNYYWRLESWPAWLEARCRRFYFPEEWEDCACGYAGETEIRLSASVPPLIPEGELVFTVYRGARETVKVPVTYAGIGFNAWAKEKLSGYGQKFLRMLKYR